MWYTVLAIHFSIANSKNLGRLLDRFTGVPNYSVVTAHPARPPAHEDLAGIPFCFVFGWWSKSPGSSCHTIIHRSILTVQIRTVYYLLTSLSYVDYIYTHSFESAELASAAPSLYYITVYSFCCVQKSYRRASGHLSKDREKID